MAKDQPWKAKGLKKDEWLAQEVAKAVGAGKPWACETVDFSDPDRPPTRIEVDFPIIPINEIAAIEGNAGKPIYQMSKWWARRRSSVFRAMLLASAIKAPDDPAEAAKLVWDAYYGNFADRGWVSEVKKVFHLIPPLDLARAWTGKHRKGTQSDYDQALFLVGACFEGSGINVNDTLSNANFRPHPALGAILGWLKTHGADSPTRNAAAMATKLYQGWESRNQTTVKQLDMFELLGEGTV